MTNSSSKTPQKNWRLKHLALLLFLLIAAAILKVIRLDHPPSLYFDEIYHVPAAKLIAEGDPRAYEWWHEPVSMLGGNFTFDWLHPPLAKLLQAGSIKLFGFNAVAWRLPSVVGSLVLTIGVYAAANFSWQIIKSSSFTFLQAKTGEKAGQQEILKEASAFGLLTALLLNLSGLMLVQSRIAMNDIWLSAWGVWSGFWFLIFTASFFKQGSSQPALFSKMEGRSLKLNQTKTLLTRLKNLDRRWPLLLTGVSLGLAGATKWSGFWFLICILGFQIFLLIYKKAYKLIPLSIFSLLLVPAMIYLSSYGQMFLQGKNFQHFLDLHKQIIWYQTYRDSGHAYASNPAAWFFNLRPVWYWQGVNQDAKLTANIYAVGSLSLQWLALPSLVLSIGTFFSNLSSELKKPAKVAFKISLPNFTWALLLALYLSSWLPWLFIKRISFYYHYLPALPWLMIFTAYFLWWLRSLSRWSFRLMLLVLIANFVVFYPHWTGLPVSKLWAEAIYFSLSSWR